jgi:hypothetical protein
MGSIGQKSPLPGISKAFRPSAQIIFCFFTRSGGSRPAMERCGIKISRKGLEILAVLLEHCRWHRHMTYVFLVMHFMLRMRDYSLKKTYQIGQVL